MTETQRWRKRFSSLFLYNADINVPEDSWMYSRYRTKKVQEVRYDGSVMVSRSSIMFVFFHKDLVTVESQQSVQSR